MSNTSTEAADREKEVKARRDRLINEQLLKAANKNPGLKQTFYWARAGSYGKDPTVLSKWTEDGESYHMADPTERNYPLAIFTTREAAVSAVLALRLGITFVVFRRTFEPQWQITSKEVALVTDKADK